MIIDEAGGQLIGIWLASFTVGLVCKLIKNIR
jgi:hypothetical protein